MKRTQVRTALVLWVIAFAAVLVGCKKEMVITRYPSFFNERMARMPILVMPFDNQTPHRGAGDNISDQLASALSANGTYTVYSAQHIKTLLDQRDLQAAMSSDPAAMAEKFRQLKGLQAQAVVVGQVSQCAATTQKDHRQDPIYQYNPKTKSTYIAGYRRYTVTRNEANVTCTAQLIRISDGSVIYATPQAVSAQAWSQGSPPKQDPYACLNRATSLAVADLVKQLAVTRLKIKIDPGKALRTAAELYDDEWEWEDKFSTDCPEAFIVVKLPPVCDRNSFRLVIVPKESRQVLLDKPIVWDKNSKTLGIPFQPAQIASRNGPGKYTIKFYSGPKPIMTQDFKIE